MTTIMSFAVTRMARTKEGPRSVVYGRGTCEVLSWMAVSNNPGAVVAVKTIDPAEAQFEDSPTIGKIIWIPITELRID